MRFSVVVPSKNSCNLIPCLMAIRRMEQGTRIIVVDDGVDWPDVTDTMFAFDPGCLIEQGEKPFIFSRNVNIGIRAAGDDDVILLNDDALLKIPQGFTMLSLVAETQPEYGIISASCNNIGNVNQHRQPGDGLREDTRMVCFVCVYIPRRTINTVGLLDERFVNYGIEDDDYCLRVRQAGLKIGIYDGCFVDHASLKSEFRGSNPGDYRPNLRLFIEKHGRDNWGNDREHSPFKECFPA